MVMDNNLIMSLGIQFSILLLSVTMIYNVFFSTKSVTNMNIIIIHLDKDNKYSSKSTIKEITSEIIELDKGYKLNHYEWNSEKNTLLLFIKPHNYDNKIIQDSRYRQLLLPDTFYPIQIKENYK